MKVFVSWSGPRSRAVAEAIATWLPQVLHGVDAWISSDIPAGRRWSDEIARQLKETNLGVLCLTADNLEAPWIMFEAGALAKQLDVAYVFPYLLDLTPGNLSGTPLALFQAKLADPDGTFDILKVLNGLLEPVGFKRKDEHLRALFDKFWSDLKAKLDAARSSGPAPAPPAADTGAMLQELLLLTRGFATTLDQRLAGLSGEPVPVEIEASEGAEVVDDETDEQADEEEADADDAGEQR